MLANDKGYWTPSAQQDVIDAAFHAEEGVTLQGTLAWSKRASVGSTRGVESPLVLRGKYKLHWQDYSEVPGKRNCKFRFLSVPVGYRCIG